MDNKEQLIEICKELRLPSIRKMVQDETNFKKPKLKFKKYDLVILDELCEAFHNSSYGKSNIM